LGRFEATTVKARIIENDAKTSRISPFGLGGEDTARRFSFSPGDKEKETIRQTLLGRAIPTA